MVALGPHVPPTGVFQFPDHFADLERHTDILRWPGCSIWRRLGP
jgi:hypothetical protein